MAPAKLLWLVYALSYHGWYHSLLRADIHRILSIAHSTATRYSSCCYERLYVCDMCKSLPCGTRVSGILSVATRIQRNRATEHEVKSA